MFVTLTWRVRDGVTPNEAAALLANAWRNAVKRLERQWKRPHIEYIAVFEKTHNGWPHLHILARAKFIPQRWLSRTMKALIGSPVVDVRRIRGQQQAINYITKYVGKEPHKFGTSKRYWFTRNYRDPADANKNKPPAWWSCIEFRAIDIRMFKEQYLRNGWLISAETSVSADIYFPMPERAPATAGWQ